MRRAAKNEAGSTLVEFAVCFLALAMFLVGTMQFCLAVYSFHYLANATHEAARYAIVRGASWGSSCDTNGTAGSGYTSSMCTASASDIAKYASERGFPAIRINTGDVCVQYYSSSSIPTTPPTTCTANTSPNSPGDIVQVTITYPFSFAIPGLHRYTYNLKSSSQMVITQ